MADIHQRVGWEIRLRTLSRVRGQDPSGVAPEASVYAGRSANLLVAAFGTSRVRPDAAWDAMRDRFEGTYLSFEADRCPGRLRGLEASHDPENVLRDNSNIPPAERRQG